MGHTQGLWEAVTRPSDGQIFGRDKAEYIIPASATEDERNPRCVAEFALVRCLSVTHSFDPCAEAAANARRIVAAVNGTSTLSTPALEAGVVDKLVEALAGANAALNAMATQVDAEWRNHDKIADQHDAVVRAYREQVRAALALARGEQA